MATKFEDNLGYNSACIGDIFEIVAWFWGSGNWTKFAPLLSSEKEFMTSY